MKLPSQSELATLAAMPRFNAQDARHAAEDALALWHAAGAVLAEQERRRDQVAASAERSAAASRAHGVDLPPGNVSLDVFLQAVFPEKDNRADRLEIFRRFLAVPNPAISKAPADAIREMRENGIGEAFAEGFAQSVREWKARQTATTNSTRSKDALWARWRGKYAADAMNGQAGQAMDSLVQNTLRKSKRKITRHEARERVEKLIAEGLIVKDGKRFTLRQAK